MLLAELGEVVFRAGVIGEQKSWNRVQVPQALACGGLRVAASGKRQDKQQADIRHGVPLGLAVQFRTESFQPLPYRYCQLAGL